MSKKNADAAPKQFLGRPGNTVKIGIVGLPNVGKSSFFNLLGELQVPAANFPFCTIDPNVTQVPVPDKRFDDLVAKWRPASVIPACLNVTDIAGLVRGAHEGKGMGNAFLSNIQAVDAIYHVTRAFKDNDIEHVEGEVDPVRDLQIITEELIQKDLAHVRRHIEPLAKGARATVDKMKKEELEILRKVEAVLAEMREARLETWGPKEIPILNTLNLLTAKPVVYLVNIAEKDYLKKGNKWLAAIQEWVTARDPDAKMIPFSVAFEQKLRALPDATARAAFEEECKVKSMVPKIITAGYKALDLIHFFTTGADEVRAWTIRRGTKAPGAAGTIHSDFETGFISAETYNYTDFIENGSDEAQVKAAGKLRTQGREYEVKDGDIIFFKSHNSSNKKR